MTKSTVVDNETGKSVDSDIRTSTGMFYSRGENEVIRRIEKRIAVASNLPEVRFDPQAEDPHEAFPVRETHPSFPFLLMQTKDIMTCISSVLTSVCP